MRKDFTPSEKVAIAKAQEEEFSEQRGRPKKCLSEDELSGRADEIVAKKAGFRGRNAYRHAKKVVQKGSAKLIEAMDSEKITITAAAQLADLSTEKQAELLNKDVKEIRGTADTLQQPKRNDRSTPDFHSNREHSTAKSSGPRQNADSTWTTQEWIRATILDLKNIGIR